MLLKHSSTGCHYRLRKEKSDQSFFLTPLWIFEGFQYGEFPRALIDMILCFFGCLFLSCFFVWLGVFFVFYLLFGCLTPNFGLLYRGQPHSLDFYHGVLSPIFDLTVTESLVTRMGPEAFQSIQWGLKQLLPCIIMSYKAMVNWFFVLREVRIKQMSHAIYFD